MTDEATGGRATGSHETGAHAPTSDAKEVAYYGALVGAWINNRMELDKTLVALSSAGIGLLVTLAAVVGASTGFELLLYCVAVLGFLATVLATLIIYWKNARVIEVAIKRDKGDRPSLRSLDAVKLITFVIAVLVSGGLVLAVAARKL